MRVLPGCGITSPRLAWLKSYSGTMSSSWFVGIVSPFRPAGFSGRNQLDGIVTCISIHDHQQRTAQRGTKRHKALFLVPEILAGQREWITQDLSGLREAYPMGAQILRCFGGIPGDPHLSSLPS